MFYRKYIAKYYVNIFHSKKFSQIDLLWDRCIIMGASVIKYQSLETIYLSFLWQCTVEFAEKENFTNVIQQVALYFNNLNINNIFLFLVL